MEQLLVKLTGEFVSLLLGEDETGCSVGLGNENDR